MTITLRTETDADATTKNAALSFSELDNNFIDLLKRSQEYISGDNGVLFTHGSTGTSIAELQFLGEGGNTAVVTSDSAGKIVVTLTSNISNETAPTLGANLALNSNKITNTGGNINLEMDASTGALELDSGTGINLKAANKIFTTTTDGDIRLEANGTGNIVYSGGQTWSAGSAVDANFSTFTNYVEGYSLPNIQQITPSGNFTIDPTAGNNYYIVPLSNSTWQGFTNITAGQTVRCIIDGVTAGPGVTITFDEFADATVLTPGGGGAITTSGAYDLVEIVCLDAGDSTGNAAYIVYRPASNIQ